ncbi:ATP-binding protein [Streptomyces sp. NPDC050509]|uniref:ATP-binding protein n=1 Tax=Streptomyces sp. NPDC050509 TaxID=3365620 RepID=UPI0037972D90
MPYSPGPDPDPDADPEVGPGADPHASHPNSPYFGAVVLRWNRHPSCVGLARLELRKALASWGLGRLEDSAVLILSELLTNAARHARVSPGREIETRYVRRPCGGLRIEVHDASSERPRRRTPELDATDGRGLVIVDALADVWGVGERNGPGKVLWAHLDPPPEG